MREEWEIDVVIQKDKWNFSLWDGREYRSGRRKSGGREWKVRRKSGRIGS